MGVQNKFGYTSKFKYICSYMVIEKNLLTLLQQRYTKLSKAKQLTIYKLAIQLEYYELLQILIHGK